MDQSAQSVSEAAVGLAEGDQPLSDMLVLLQHPGNGPKHSKLGLSRSGDRVRFPGQERRNKTGHWLVGWLNRSVHNIMCVYLT